MKDGGCAWRRSASLTAKPFPFRITEDTVGFALFGKGLLGLDQPGLGSRQRAADTKLLRVVALRDVHLDSPLEHQRNQDESQEQGPDLLERVGRELNCT